MSELQDKLDVSPKSKTATGRSAIRDGIDYLLSSSPSPPGFRFSRTDASSVVVAIAAAGLLWRSLHEMALLFPIVLGHFFLFCNVFRVCRASELAWAGLFVINFTAWALCGHFAWWHVLAAQTPVTLFLIVLEILSPRYHGVGHHWIGRTRTAGPPTTMERRFARDDP